MGRFWNASIKGRYDCRVYRVPNYQFSLGGLSRSEVIDVDGICRGHRVGRSVSLACTSRPLTDFEDNREGAMRAMLTVVAICITILFPRPIWGASVIMGAGGESCGAWVVGRKGDRGIMFATWVIGYLSGRAQSEGSSALRMADYDAITTWMDNYCAANPLDAIVKGTDRLHQELQERARKK